MTTRLCRDATASTASMSAGCPYRWTGTMARVRGVTAAPWSCFQSQAEIDDGAQDAPPVDERPHFRVPELMRRINLRDRNLAMPVPQRDRLQQEVRLELVAVEPVLAPVDSRIAKQRGSKRAKAVRALGDALAGGEREDERVDDARPEYAVQGHVAEPAAAKIARALHEIGRIAHDRIDERRNLQRIVLVVARLNDQHVVALVERVPEDALHRRAYTEVPLVAQHDDGRIHPVERAVGRAIVDDEQIVRARARVAGERLPDLLALVVGKRGGEDARHVRRQRPRLSTGSTCRWRQGPE